MQLLLKNVWLPWQHNDWDLKVPTCNTEHKEKTQKFENNSLICFQTYIYVNTCSKNKKHFSTQKYTSITCSESSVTILVIYTPSLQINNNVRKTYVDKQTHVNIKREVSLLLLRMSGFSQQTKEMLHLFPFTRLTRDAPTAANAFHYNTERPFMKSTSSESSVLDVLGLMKTFHEECAIAVLLRFFLYRQYLFHL